MSELTELIRNALNERDVATAPAVTDLHDVTRRYSDAIAATTIGEATFALERIDPTEVASGKGDPYALLLCWNQDERIVRVAEVGLDGYPIKFFRTLAGWRERGQLVGDAHDRTSLDAYFRDLVTKRDSDVVAMLRFIIGNTATQPAATA